METLLTSAMGKELTFDIQINHVGTVHNNYGDVQIRTSSGQMLMMSLPTFPALAPAWSSYTVKLDETSNWRINAMNGTIATKAQIVLFLTQVESIRICVTYGNSNFAGAIDNVVVTKRTIPVAPKITGFAPLSGKAGDLVTINGSDFDATAANNVVFFSGVKANITAASATQLTVTVPQNVSPGTDHCR